MTNSTQDIDIPILVICFNNGKYVRNTIESLCKIDSTLKQSIRIINNTSTDQNTIKILDNYRVSGMSVTDRPNNGPWINQWCNTDLYDALPEKFIITDPDLEYNIDMPTDFRKQMSELSDKLSSYKLGLAIGITDSDKMYQHVFYEGLTIWEYEKRFWERIVPDHDNVYHGEVDTTFCLINKTHAGNQSSYRLAGNFTCRHLPYYPDSGVNTIHDDYLYYLTSKNSTTSRILKEYFNDYLIVGKNSQTLLIRNKESDPNLSFWTINYPGWETETFEVFDRYLDRNKIFIDIGGWIGTTCIYGSRLSKQTYVVECDPESIKSLEANCHINTDTVTIVNRAIYNTETHIHFGRNQHLINSKLNDSTSQIHESADQDTISIPTITINGLIERYSISPSDISLVKVDIEGSEEYILEQVYNFCKTNNIRLYLSFHYSWWKNPNLNRFEFLDEGQKNHIRMYPFCSLLF